MKLSLEQVRDKVYAALQAKAGVGLYVSSFYIRATFPNHCIVEKSGSDKLFKVPYKLNGSDVELGEETAVEIEYKPVAEAFAGTVLGPLRAAEGEAEGSRWSVVIIEAGTSKNKRRYKEAVLEAAAPLYEGVPVFWDHQYTPGARSARDLAGFISDPSYAQIGTKSGGSRAAVTGTLNVTDPALRTGLLEAWKLGKPGIYGLSHDAAAEQELVSVAEGTIRDVKKIVEVFSVDVVSTPAAGGRVERIVAGGVTGGAVDTSVEGEKMFEYMLGLLRKHRPTVVESFGATPTETQVREAFEREFAQPATPAAPAAPAAPATPAAPVAAPALEGVEAGELRSIVREAIIARALEGRTLPAAVAETVREELRERPTLTAADATKAVERAVAMAARLASGGVQGSGLGTVVETTLDEADKLVKALDGFFQQKPVDNVPAFRSFKEGYILITGDRELSGRTREAVGLRRFARMTEALDSTSWGEILGDSIRRAMLADYKTPSYLDDWRKIVSDVTTITDFRTNRRLRLGGYADLATVTQGSAYAAMTSPTDEEATYEIAKRGGTESITIEAIANDDVGAIRRIPASLSRAAKRTLYKAVFNLIVNNSNIYDGTALGTVGHANLITTALSAANAAEARRMMIEQTRYNVSDEQLNLFPRTLIVPPELEELAFRLTQIQMAAVSGQNATEPSFTRSVGLTQAIVLPYQSDANNYAFVADTADIPTIEVGFWQGRQEPELFIQDNPTVGSLFTNDKIDYKIRFVFGVAVLDYRGFVLAVVA